MNASRVHTITLIPTLLGLAICACDSSKVPEPGAAAAEKPAKAETAAASPTPTAAVTAAATAAATAASAAPSAGAAATTAPTAAPAVKIPARPVATVAVAEGDPVKGVWTLENATQGLPKEGNLFATIDTEKGKLECELWDDKAPITVANFIGLARGTRPWKNPAGSWVKKPLYDGTVFHRIVKGFMIQGGDPKGNGSGDAGFVIPDEIWENGSHDQRGLLCMANRGVNTNSSQFFILDAPSTYLDGKYTIFGKCSPDSVIETLAGHKVVGDRAVDPPSIKKVTIERRK